MSQDCLSFLEVVGDWDLLHVWICLVVAIYVGEDFQGLSWDTILSGLRKSKESIISSAR